MAGLVGFVDQFGNDKADTLLADMARALKHEEWYQVDLYQEKNVGLGRVSLGLLNPEPQPIWNEDRTLCIVMEGEVYDYGEEKQRLIERGHRFRVHNDPEYVMHLYSEYGDDFARRLNGAFVAAIWNSQTRRLLIVNDHMGLRPLYYVQLNGRLLFASGARAVVVAPSFERKVNPVALSELLSFEHLLGNHTLFEGVNLLPPASVMVYQEGRLNIRPYWELQFPETYEYHDEEYYINRWSTLVRQAVTRQMRGPEPLAVLLTGGLDSRTILALMDREQFSVRALTFGQPDSDDVHLAREVAASLDVEHHFFQLRPDYLIHLAEEGVRLTDGMMNSCVHMQVLGPLRDMAKQARVFYKGYLGGTIHGLVVSSDLLAPFEEHVMARRLFQIRNRIFREEEHERLFAEPFYQQVRGQAFESFLVALQQCNSTWAADKNNYFDIQDEDRRFTLGGVELARSQAVVRTPLTDKDFVEFALTVPPGLRQNKSYYRKAFAQAFPSLAKIPYEVTGLPLISCFRDLRIRLNQLVRWHLQAAGLKWIPASRKHPYADYNSWMRTVLRGWVEETLLNKHALERGYFRPDYIRNLVAEHMAGANHARKLGILITLELWHRLFID
jgi:asparagine synthase (glutamine-hydrolysing)